MSITVHNALSNEAIFKDFVEWCLVTLSGDESSLIQNVDVVFDDTIMQRKRWGELIPIKHEGDTVPLKFTMNIFDSYQMMRSLRYIAHETVHISQLVGGYYSYDPINDVVQWQGMTYDDEDFPPGFEPWEIQARGLENCLVETYILERGYQDERWYQPLD
jgi:hypothetical protein